MRKRTYRPIKQAVFVACEGKSELGYVRWLNRLADAEGVPVSITGRDMKGGGAGKIADRAARVLLRSAGGPALLAIWPAYRKGLDATEYEREISTEHLVRARANLPELEAFLIDIGWG